MATGLKSKNNTPSRATTNNPRDGLIPEETLDDLSRYVSLPLSLRRLSCLLSHLSSLLSNSRFIINLPSEEKKEVVRVMFGIELAHWFYIDHVIENEGLPRVKFEEFTRVMMKHVPFLRKHANDVDNIIEKFKEYKSSVPTYGAILLDTRMEKCLMVQGMKSRNNWGFPKGKINKNEAPLLCAIREVKEEISFDCTSLINKDDCITKNFHGTEMTLYIVAGVDLDQEFAPATKNEIRGIHWFDIDDLPDDFKVKPSSGLSFFMAIPFVKDLRDWIRKKRLEELKGLRIKQREKREGRKRADTNNEGVSLMKEIPVQRPVGRNAFWTHHWENVQLDWKSIWSHVNQELGLVQ